MSNRMRNVKIFIYSALLVVLGVVLGTLIAPNANSLANDNSLVFDNMQISSPLIQEMERAFSELYNRAAPGVVSIIVVSENGASGATGSGFVIDSQGHIVTNFHVVEDADYIEINMFDGTITEAELVGVDPDSDIAVIQIDVPADRLRPLPFADSDALQVGQTVLALGNPFSNNWTLTSGIVSALNRTRQGFTNFSIGGVIQTDAAINPGNSGGPLLNLNGEVVGVNSQIDGGQRISGGVGFAVPSNLVKRVAQELMETGRVRYSYLGIRAITPMSLAVIERFGLPDNLRGVVVEEATRGDPAERGGVQSVRTKSVDVILAIDGKPLKDFDDMIAYLAIHTIPGQTVNLTVYRDGDILTLPVTLGER